MSEIISVKKLTKKYGNFRAVSNISFNVQESEIFGLIGPNGAGKSTLIKVLAGIEPLGEGSRQCSSLTQIKMNCFFSSLVYCPSYQRHTQVTINTCSRIKSHVIFAENGVQKEVEAASVFILPYIIPVNMYHKWSPCTR